MTPISERYTVDVEKAPSQHIDCGTDWKQNLLDKAAVLDLYEKLDCHDNNRTPLPFGDAAFQTIYSNSIYWVPQVEALVKDIWRMLGAGGTAVLEVMTPTLLETLDQVEPIIGRAATRILDRNRRVTMPGLRRPSEWKRIFQDVGFTIEDARCVYPDKVLIDIWNIGLRPVSHLLIQMVEQLDPQDRGRIKQEWVDIFHILFQPLLNIPLTYEHERSPYLLYILRK